jgi:carboxypeptidase family protein
MFKAGFASSIVLFFVANLICAQAPTAADALIGTVVDPQGALVARATITVETKGVSRTLYTDEIGGFKVQLPPGKYRLTAEAVGFHKYRRKIVIGRGRIEPLRIKLDVIVQKFKCPPGHICL